MDENLERYFFEKTIPKFQQLAILLHELIIDSHPDIRVSMKWQMPAYDYKGVMIGLGAFKHKVTLFFHRGSEIEDSLNLFDGQENNKTMRSIQFTSVEEVNDDLVEYINKAIKVHDSGKRKIVKASPKPLPEMIPEFKRLLSENPLAETFFSSLNKTHKREYIVWINSAKREETKTARLAKAIEKLNANQTCWSKYNSK